MRKLHVVLSSLLLLSFGACADSYPGGGPGSQGGAGGDGAGAGSGGTIEPLPVSFPTFTVDVRSQLWAPNYVDDGLLPSSYELLFLDQGRACGADGLRIDEGEGWIAVSLVGPALGTCDVRTQYSTYSEYGFHQRQPGCHAYVRAGRGAGAALYAVRGSLRIDRIEGATVAGELNLKVPERPVENYGCWLSEAGNGPGEMHYLDSGCDCGGPDGYFACDSSGPDDIDCCDDGFRLIDVTFPFETTRCTDATWCWTQPCAPYLVGSCRPEPAAPPSCETACDAYVATCLDCVGCADGACEDRDLCDRDRCVATCRGLGSADPLVSLSLSCVQTAVSCGDWASCVSACGEP